MAETKWTPGPWTVETLPGSSDGDYPDAHFVKGGGRTIADVGDLADARIIASATDLYEALEEAVEAIEWNLPAKGECKCGDEFRCVAHLALDIAHRSLARARGEQP